MNFSQSKVKIRLILGFLYRNKPLSTVNLYLWRHKEKKGRKEGCTWRVGLGHFFFFFWFKFSTVCWEDFYAGFLEQF